MTTVNTITTNEAEIRQLIADQQLAICTKDINQIMSRYAIEAVFFDVKPPFQTKQKRPKKRYLGCHHEQVIVSSSSKVSTRKPLGKSASGHGKAG